MRIYTSPSSFMRILLFVRFLRFTFKIMCAPFFVDFYGIPCRI
ncbi:hypothetical protein HMPREF1870_00623 [Bacteroidales bacterium KA00344]|nr:hypothetical protein HMPREF1870_00623 [Bacteroidales bacterium KA00344]